MENEEPEVARRERVGQYEQCIQDRSKCAGTLNIHEHHD